MAAARTLPVRGAVVAVVVVLAAGCGGSSGKKAVIAPVGRGEVREVVEAPATVTAKASSTLSSPGSGFVGKLYVHDGASVKRGQTLMVVSSPQAQLRLTQAKQADAKAASGDQPISPTDLTGFLGSQDAAANAAFDAAEQAVQLIPDAKTRAAQWKRLMASKAQYASSRSQAAQAIASLDKGIGGLSRALSTVAAAQRTQTQAAVSLAQQAISALTIKAPIAGVVQLGGPAASSSSGDLSGALSQLPAGVQGQASQLLGGSGSGDATASTTISLGTPVNSGTTLATITDGSTLTLAADVDETDVLLVRRGTPATAELDAVPGSTYAGVVQDVGQTPTTSAEGGVTYRVRLSLGAGHDGNGAAAPRPRPGMSAVADLVVRDVKDAVTVPASAVLHAGNRDYVWADDNGVARRVDVTLGAQGDDVLQVLKGVAVGGRIVVQNAVDVTEGQKLPR